MQDKAIITMEGKLETAPSFQMIQVYCLHDLQWDFKVTILFDVK